MDFELSGEQEMLKSVARDFLTSECPNKHVRAMMEDELGYSPELWQKMAELGWLGLTLPEEYGGAGMGFRDLSILCEEMGRVLLPGPFIPTVVLAGTCILMAGSEEQKKEYLPQIADGKAIFTLAVLEEDGDFWAGGIKVKAVSRQDEYVINGSKLFVTDAKAADYILCAARTKRTTNPEEGITLFLVKADEWGVYAAPLKTMDETRKQYELSFTNVAVPMQNIVGELHQGWPILKEAALRAATALCAEMVGGGEMVLEMTVNYAKDRIAFGVPIGSFQAIKHKCADMYSDLEYARSLMEWAALTIDEEPSRAAVAVSMAKSYCGDAYKHVVGEGIQIHGGIGFTWDHDMHLYFKRARSSDTAFGDSNYHRELVAQSFD